jgi:hypothetical protein
LDNIQILLKNKKHKKWQKSLQFFPTNNTKIPPRPPPPLKEKNSNRSSNNAKINQRRTLSFKN